MVKLSIVTICYNNKKELRETINSLISQTFNDYEYIIIDGGSKDGSVEIIREYANHINFWVSEPDKGIYNAMNKGLAHCYGEWVYFLNSGDVFYNDRVLASIDFEGVSEKVGAIYGRYKFYSRYNELILNEVKHPFTESERKYRSMGFSHQSVFVRTKLAQEIGFDESFKLCADYNMMMRIYRAGYVFKRDNTIIAICDGRGGASYKNRALQDKETAIVCGCQDDMVIVSYLWLINVLRPIYRYINSIIKR